MSFVLILAFSIPLGIFTARHAGGRLDRAMTAVNQALMAIPAFVTGILLTYVFGLVLRWFVPGNYVSPGDNFGGSLWYFLFPAVSAPPTAGATATVPPCTAMCCAMPWGRWCHFWP